MPEPTGQKQHAACFAVTAPGLAGLAAAELRSMGINPGAPESGGVSFQAIPPILYRANLRLRTASRVLMRLGSFEAVTFPELRQKAAALEWQRFVRPGQPVALRVTCHKSKLYHSGAVAERVLQAIGDRLGSPTPAAQPPEDGDDAEQAQNSTAIPAQLFIVRFDRDHCTISADTSGALLHRRGYRLAVAKAPLRETLAAAMLLASGWDAASPLIDPFCGSGTIAIEAALLASGQPPGCARGFAFQNWPSFQPDSWQQERAACDIAARPVPPILASDRDAGAVRMAQENAERAGVAQWIAFSTRAVSAIEPPVGPGWVITNPPYGQRTASSKDLRNLYAQFGNRLRAACPGWRFGVLSSDLSLLGQIGFPFETAFATHNGGLNVRLVRGVVAAP